MSPLGSPCPKLKKCGTFYFCDDYENRPEECANHRHPFAVCPIGVEKLGVSSTKQLFRRIDTGYAMLKCGLNDPDKAYEALVNAECGLLGDLASV